MQGKSVHSKCIFRRITFSAEYSWQNSSCLKKVCRRKIIMNLPSWSGHLYYAPATVAREVYTILVNGSHCFGRDWNKQVWLSQWGMFVFLSAAAPNWLSCAVQKQAEQLLQQNQQLLEYISELVGCLGQAKSISLNHLASSAPDKVRCMLRELFRSFD